jgi:hypothetical protein
VLCIALVSTLAEAKSIRIHVIAKVVETTFTGESDNPKIGDQRITTVNLYDKNETKVGTGMGGLHARYHPRRYRPNPRRAPTMPPHGGF